MFRGGSLLSRLRFAGGTYRWASGPGGWGWSRGMNLCPPPHLLFPFGTEPIIFDTLLFVREACQIRLFEMGRPCLAERGLRVETHVALCGGLWSRELLGDASHLFSILICICIFISILIVNLESEIPIQCSYACAC